jgi:hypothetical protein
LLRIVVKSPFSAVKLPPWRIDIDNGPIDYRLGGETLADTASRDDFGSFVCAKNPICEADDTRIGDRRCIESSSRTLRAGIPCVALVSRFSFISLISFIAFVALIPFVSLTALGTYLAVSQGEMTLPSLAGLDHEQIVPRAQRDGAEVAFDAATLRLRGNAPLRDVVRTIAHLLWAT